MIKLSPSKLNIFNDCPRCFWLQENKGLKRPRGIMSSLPIGIDRIAKTYLDICREKGTLPAELKELAGKYVLYRNQADLSKWRNWRTGLAYESPQGAVLSGALDDLLVTPDGDMVSPFDIKTKGKEPGGLEESQKYYQHQMDCYTLLMEKNGMKTTREAHLLYFYPVEMAGPGITFKSVLIIMPTDPARAAKTCMDAINCLASDKEPQRSASCEYCNYMSTASGI